jgi:hypothetical protein
MTYELIRKMRVVPIALNDFIAMALPGAIPYFPSPQPLCRLAKY